MSRLLAQTVDEERLKAALKFVKTPGDHFPMVRSRCIELLKYVRRIESDIESERAGHIAGMRPQDRREQFSKIAQQLEKIAVDLEIFSAPRVRQRENPEFYPTAPIGFRAFRQAVAEAFSPALSAQYIASFGFEPLQWPEPQVNAETINAENRSFGIYHNAEFIISDLLKRLSQSLLVAEAQLANGTKGGGPRRVIIREFILVNVVALWQELHQAEVEASYYSGNTKFFRFCQAMCEAFGARNFCTAVQLREAVKSYNLKRHQKPDDI